MLELIVKTLDSQNHSFTLNEDATVLVLKECIVDKMQVPRDTQRLIFHGKVLQDEKKLTDYGDVNGKVIHLVQRAPPSTTRRPNDSNRNRSNSEGPSVTPGRRMFRRIDGNATYLGALTIPADFIDAQGLIQPSTSQTLSRSRVNVARRMLRSANNTMTNVESNEPSNSRNQPPSTSQRTANPLDAAAAPRLDANSEQRIEGAGTTSSDDTVFTVPEPVTTTQNSLPDDNVNIDVALEVEVVSETPPGDTVNTENGAENRNDSRVPMGVDSLADLFQNLDETVRRMLPLLQQSRETLAADPTLTDSNRISETQNFFNGTSETLHLLAHALHAASDLIVDFNDPTPRFLRCRPVLVQHSAVLENTFPLHLNQINLGSRPVNRPSGPGIPNVNTPSSGVAASASQGNTRPIDPTLSSATPISTTTSSNVSTSSAVPGNSPFLFNSALTSALAASAAAAAAAAAAVSSNNHTMSGSSGISSTDTGSENSQSEQPLNGTNLRGPGGMGISVGPQLNANSGQSLPGSGQGTPIFLGGIGGSLTSGSSQGPNSDNFEIFVNFTPEVPSGGIVQAMHAVTAEILQNRFMRPTAGSSTTNQGGSSDANNGPPVMNFSAPSVTAEIHLEEADLPRIALIRGSGDRPLRSFQGQASGLATSGEAPVNSQNPPSTSNNVEAGVPPSATVGGQNPQQRPQRRRIHLGNTFHNLLNSTPFDLFLPCTSHHIRSSNNIISGRNLGNRTTLNIDIASVDRPEVWRPIHDPDMPTRPFSDDHPATSASAARSQQSGGNLFLNILSNILGRWYLHQTSSLPNGRLTVADVVRRVIRNFQTSNNSLILDLLMTVAHHVRFLDTLAMASSTEGLETLANLVRPILTGFANFRLLAGEAPNETNITRAADRLSNEIRQYVNLGVVTTVRLRDTIDLMATINRFNQSHLPGIITLVVESANENNFGTFGTNLIRQLTIYVCELLAILVHCCTEGPHDFGVLVRNFVLISTQGAPLEVREGAEQFLMNSLREFFLDLDVSGERVQPYLVYRAPPVSHQEPMDTDSPCTEGAWGTNESLSQPLSSPEKVSDEPLTDVLAAMETENIPEILIGSESWHNALPSDWVPVIARDAQKQRQRRQSTTPKPLSDAYLSGMPPKRRKLITSTRNIPSDLPVSISEGVRDAIRASGVNSAVSSTTLERIVADAAHDPGLVRAYRVQEKLAGARSLRSNPDFTPTRFPNANKYFKQ